MGIDWIEFSKSIPEIGIALFVVWVIFRIQADNRAAANSVMLTWQDYMKEEAEKNRNILEEIIERHKQQLIDENDKNREYSQKREEASQTAISEITKRYEQSISFLTGENKTNNQAIVNIIERQTNSMDKQTIAISKMDMSLRKLLARLEKVERPNGN